MCKAEASADRVRYQLRHSSCGDQGFGLNGRVRLGVFEQVSHDRCARTVVIVVH